MTQVSFLEFYIVALLVIFESRLCAENWPTIQRLFTYTLKNKCIISFMEKLKKVLAEKIEKVGPITFADFMEIALYYPELGYYTGSKNKIGKEGDFYTATNVSELFGETIAGRLLAALEDIGAKDANIIEIGAGTGQLAFDILSELRDEDIFEGLNYFIVEKSPDFIFRQSQKLSEFKDKVIWTDTLEISKDPIAGVILQNEVVDAFSVHKITMTKDGLKEIYVDHDEDFREVIKEPSTGRLLKYMKTYGCEIDDGQVAEVNLAAIDWMTQLGKMLKKGIVVTIDYGGAAAEIYSKSRMYGTLNYYYRHELVDSPFKHLGEQDITSHVNFSALEKRGEEIGLETISFESMANFLMRNGIIERVENIQNSDISDNLKIKARLAIKNLIMPQAMGDRFKVLIQEKSGR